MGEARSFRVLLITSASVLACSTAARADTLANIRQRGELVWGADQEGGGPYAYPDPLDPSKVIGFEVDLADLLAAELGVKARFSQGDWNTLPEILRSGSINIILNGYEWTPQRAARMSASRPYYIYELQLLGRAENPALRTWDDLKRITSHRPQVAVLRGTAAADYCKTKLTYVDVVEYDGTTDAMAQVRNGLHDATLTDWVAAVFYRDKPQAAGLQFIGEPVAPGYYVIYARPGESSLIAAINSAIEKAFRDGRLRKIYEKYGVWNKTQERLLSATPQAETPAAASTSWDTILRCGPVMLKAAGMTVLLSVCSMPLAIIVGLFVALGRMYGPRGIRGLLGFYVEILRGTPVMLQLYFIYFLLPVISPIALSPLVAAIAGLAINYSAYEAEIYRAGLQAIPVGQMEAALALGMSKAAALRRVIVPQAVRLVIPPVTNDFIALFKDTSVCSVITVTELTKEYNVLANSTGAIIPLAAMTAILYLAMSYPLSVLTSRLEARHD
ncbi:MAG TPA: ABC transporter substrate-binding protein/permease [Phycisphaerae bacterium]|nr:ABC transporter substrate-binding protein/permease [Phycisphaerae bacterium]